MRVVGRVVSGRGVGAYYVMLKPYYELFTALLGSPPYPGTLNVALPRPYRELLRFEYIYEPPGHGAIEFSLGRVNDEPCVVLRPRLTKNPENVVEIVARVCLREKLGLRDGDVVIVELENKDIKFPFVRRLKF